MSPRATAAVKISAGAILLSARENGLRPSGLARIEFPNINCADDDHQGAPPDGRV